MESSPMTPPQVAPQHPMRPMPGAAFPSWRPVRSTRGLAIALSLLVPLSVLFGVLQQSLQPTTMTFENGTLEARRDGWSALTIPLELATIIVGLVWVFRVASNARAVGDPTRPSPGWAMSSFLIPVAHIVLPLFPLHQAWTKSRAGSGALFWAWGAGWMLHLTAAYIIGAWSAAWGFSQGLEAGTGPVVLDIPASIITSQWIATAVSAIAAALFLALVWKFDAAQRGMAAYLARQQSGMPQAAGGPAPTR